MGLSEDLEKIALQERELRLPRLDARVAWELGSRLRTMAVERGLHAGDRRAAIRAAAVLCGARRHHAGQSRNGCAARATWWRASIAARMAWV